MAENRVTTELVDVFIAEETSLARVTTELVDVFIAEETSNARVTTEFVNVFIATTPVITGVSAPICSGEALTISGGDFGDTQGSSTLTLTDADAVVFNPTITSWSDASIAITIPAAAVSGAATLTITTSLGSDAFDLTIAVCTFPSTAVRNPQGRRLGCGDYDVYIQTRGGDEVVAVFPHESVTFGRRLDEFSEAEITGGLDGGSCDPALYEIEPWVHEVSIRRDAVEEWVGPIVGLTWTQESLTLRARDLFAWLERRVLPHDRDMTTDLATIAAQFIADALEGDTSPNITAVPNATGIIGRRTVVGATYRRAADEIREIARTGLDFTAIGRTIRFGGSELPALPLVTLIDGIFEIGDLTVDGIATATQVIVLGESSDEGSAPIAGVAGGIGTAGLVQQVFDEGGIRDAASAQAAAEGHLSLLETAPEFPTGVLLDGAPVAFGDLIPGARVDAALTVGGREVVGTYRLLGVDVVASASDAGVEETVTISLQPLGAVDES